MALKKLSKLLDGRRHEKDLQAACLVTLATIKGCRTWRNNSGAIRASHTDKAGRTRERVIRLSPKGFSDIFLLTDGPCFVGIECKVGKRKSTPEQVEFREMLNEMGHVGIEVRDTVDHMLDQLVERGVLSLGGAFWREKTYSTRKQGD